MSLEAFDIILLIPDLPLKICAVATWGDRFFVSTVSNKNEAHLLVYKFVSGPSYCEAKLEKTLKKFTAKPIISIAIVEDYGLFFGLTSDSELCCGSLIDYQLTSTILPRIRYCTCFAIDWHRLKAKERKLRICLAACKKLYIHNYNCDQFSLEVEINLWETPRLVSWIGDNIIVCIKKEMICVSLDGTSRNLFSIGQNRTKPFVLPITRKHKKEMLVLQDEKQVFLDHKGHPTQPAAIVWSDIPLCIEHIHPYVIGVLPRGIEVRALEQKILVQNFKLPDQSKDPIKFISHHKMTIIASHSQVYKLEPKVYYEQVQHFVHGRQFELALEVAELIEESASKRETRREEILRQYAFYLFTQHDFETSLKYYLEIKEDPVNVICLYPHLLPSDIRQNLNTPLNIPPPTLTGEDLRRAMKCLINYLTQMRYEEQQNLHSQQEEVEARLQIIDTTLLKCYIKTNNNTLIGSLVRLPDNHLHLGESERVLRNDKKFQELVHLFRTKSQHRKALELLQHFHQGPSGPLVGVWPTIDYLQNLGKDNIELILEFSKWVLKEHPMDGLKIFTEEIGEVESLPRDKVLDHLTQCAPDLKTEYLEHIIHCWSDKLPQFHNTLVLIYKEQIETKLETYVTSLKGRPRARAGEEPDGLGFLRSKLLNFLQSSMHYKPENLISKFPANDLFEERALLLGRLGKHEVALAIYAHILKDPKMAEDYCKRIYDPENEENKEVYLHLIRVYLDPPPLQLLAIYLSVKQSEDTEPTRDIITAMSILASYHEKIDTAKVMEMLPSDTKILDINSLLEENLFVNKEGQSDTGSLVVIPTQGCGSFRDTVKWIGVLPETPVMDGGCTNGTCKERFFKCPIGKGFFCFLRSLKHTISFIDKGQVPGPIIGNFLTESELPEVSVKALLSQQQSKTSEVLYQVSEVDSLQAKIETTSRRYEEQIHRLAREMEKIQREKEELARKNEEIETNLMVKEGILHQQLRQNAMLANEREKLKEEKAAVERINASLGREKVNLEGEKRRLEQEKKTLENDKATLKDEKAVMERKLQGIREEKQKFQDEQQKLQEENQKLQNERQQLQEKVLANEKSWKISHKDVKITKQELGRGGWGVIWVGEFRGQKVAVKQIHELIASEEFLQLLHREIDTMSQLRHPNLVQFIGAVLDDPSSNPMIVTEIMDMSLREAYEKKQLTPVPASISLSVMHDVAVGLNYLHCLPDPIIHRDVSSANVLLESKGPGKWKTKISDFGSAKFARSAVTKAAGAAAYSAPEAFRSILDSEEDQPLTPKMDVFSYGVLLCEVLTCQFPDQQVFKAMLALVRSQHHPYLHDLIQSCIKRNPQDRPNMDQIIQQLD